MRRYLRQLFSLDLVRPEEFSSVLNYTIHVYQFFTLNQEPTLRLHIDELLARGLATLPNLCDSGEPMLEKRRNVNRALAHFFD